MAPRSGKSILLAPALAALALCATQSAPAFAQPASGFVGRCQALWSRIVSGTSGTSTKAQAQIDETKVPAIQRLKELLDAEPESNVFRHELYLAPEGWTLQIGYLERHQKKFMALVIRSIEEGGLVAIEAGNVVGPKVLILLNRVRNDAIRAGKPLTIHGFLSPEVLMEKIRMQRALGISEKFNPNLPDHWTRQELQDFEKAWKELGIESCDPTWPRNRIAICRFKISVRDGKSTFSIQAE